MNTNSRFDGRQNGQTRPVVMKTGVSPYAEGSCEVSFGETKVLVTASVEKGVPPWMDPEAGGGWVTAEYGMLPRSTHTRNRREAASGKQSGRTQEIQRLIGRSLRQAVDLSGLKGLTIRLDCDVLCADGGTRTAAISGGWVALAQAIAWAKQEDLLPSSFVLTPVFAISVGVFEGQELLDLCYREDSQADFDLNVVFRGEENNLVEIQGTAEKVAINREQLLSLVDLAASASKVIRGAQNSALAG